MLSVDPAARWLYVVGLAWSNEQTTDGWIDEASMKIVMAQAGATKKHLAQLVDSELIRSEFRAYFIENWEIHNLSREDQEGARAKNRAKQKTWRDQQKQLKNEDLKGTNVTRLLTGVVTAPRTEPNRTEPFVDENEDDSSSFVRESIAIAAAARFLNPEESVRNIGSWKRSLPALLESEHCAALKAYFTDNAEADPYAAAEHVIGTSPYDIAIVREQRKQP